MGGQQVENLVQHGATGLVGLGLWIIFLLIMGGFVLQIRQLNRGLQDQLEADRKEREQMARDSKAERESMRFEYVNLATVSRQEVTQVALAAKASIYQLCTELSTRPCLHALQLNGAPGTDVVKQN